MIKLYKIDSDGDIETVFGRSLREIYKYICGTLSVGENRSENLFYDEKFDSVAMIVSLYAGNSRIYDKNGKVIYRA